VLFRSLEDHVKDVSVSVKTNDMLSVKGQSTKTLAFNQPGDDIIFFKIKVGDRQGVASVFIKAAAGGESAEQRVDLDIRMPGGPVVDVVQSSLSPGKSWRQDISLPGIAGTNKALLEVSRIPPIDLGKRISYLIRYPHGCVEQTTSSVFPQLYLGKLLALSPEKQQDGGIRPVSEPYREYSLLSLNKFLFLSLCTHGIAIAALIFLPAETGVQKKKDELFARLVTPDELIRPEIRPVPLPLPRPPMPETGRVIRRPLPPQRAMQATPPAPILPPAPALPSEKEPVVPGEGREYGRPLPDGISPGADGEKKAGDRRGQIIRERPARQAPLGRAGLYDREGIGDLAKKDGSGLPKKENAITFDTSEYRFKGYMRKLREKIESIWVYPPEARMKGIYGDLKIRFTIKKDGRLGAIELVRTSGYRMLDEAAMKALKDGEPYWPLPDEWGMDSYTILGHFIYSMGGYYLR